MGSLVGDEVGAGKDLVHGRLRVQEDAPVRELYGTGMLHPAELIARYDYEIVFLERKGDAGIVLHPPDGRGCLAEHLGELRHLVGVGLTVVAVHSETVQRLFRHLPLPCHEGEKIGADGLRIIESQLFTPVSDHFGKKPTVAYGHPFLGKVQLKGEYRLEVRLVEAGENGPRQRGNEQRVHIAVVPVKGLVARDEADLDTVLPFRQASEQQMLRLPDDRAVLTIDSQGLEASGVLTEIQLDIPAAVQFEGQDLRSLHGLRLVFRKVESEPVADIGNMRGPVTGKSQAHARLHCRSSAPRQNGASQKAPDYLSHVILD